MSWSGIQIKPKLDELSMIDLWVLMFKSKYDWLITASWPWLNWLQVLSLEVRLQPLCKTFLLLLQICVGAFSRSMQFLFILPFLLRYAHYDIYNRYSNTCLFSLKFKLTTKSEKLYGIKLYLAGRSSFLYLSLLETTF